MRKFAAVTIMLFVTFSVALAQKGKKKGTSKSTSEDGYEITVKVNNATDSICYLAYHFGSKKYVKDTTTVNKKGEFVFSGTEPLGGGVYIVYFEDKRNFEIIVNEQKFHIETDNNNFIDGFKTEDSEENKTFYEFQKFTSNLNKEAGPLVQRNKEIDSLLNDDSTKKKIREELKAEKDQNNEKLKKFGEDVKAFKEKIYTEKPDLFITKNLKAVEEIAVPKDITKKEDQIAYYKEHYFDNIDLSDDRMLRTPFFEKKFTDYVEKWTVQDADSLIKTADFLISHAKPGSEMLKFMIVTLVNKYHAPKIMCLERVYIHMVNNYYVTGKSYWADSAQVAKLQERATTLSWTACGTQTPNLQRLQDTAGIYRELYRQPAEFMILYFWDPDCGHCKKATPKLVTAYNTTLKDMGVRIYAVCTSKDKKKWTKFINEKGMQEWINVYDPEYKSPFRQWYDVTSTPKLYVVDKRKKVIARQLGVEQVADFLKQYIKNEENKKNN